MGQIKKTIFLHFNRRDYAVYIVFSTFNLLITFYFIKIFFIYFLLIRSQKITSMRIYSNEVPQITKTCTPFAQAAKFMSVKLPPFQPDFTKVERH